MKLLTIIVPSYNMEQYLPKCLGSLVVAPELMEKLEVIVVNDGSKDHTSEIAHEFETKYPGSFKVIDKGNGHYGSCINAALPVATGVYVKVLDADDTFCSSALAIFLTELMILASGSVQPDLILTDYCYVSGAGNVISTWHYTFGGAQCMCISDLQRVPFDLVMYGFTYRRSLFDGLQYRQTEGIAYTDSEWTFQPMLYARDVRHIPVVLYHYLIGREGQSISMSCIGDQIKQQCPVLFNNLKIFEKAYDAIMPANRDYAVRQLIRLSSIVYNVYFRFAEINRIANDIPRIDKQIMAVSKDVGLALRQKFTLFPSRMFAFRYCKLLIEHPRMAWLCIAVARINLKFRGYL